MFTFSPGRRYLVATPVGMIVGTFARQQASDLVFSDVVEIVEVGDGEVCHRVDAGQVIDAEPWLQSVPLVDYSVTAHAKAALDAAVKRGDVVVPRVRKVS